MSFPIFLVVYMKGITASMIHVCACMQDRKSMLVPHDLAVKAVSWDFRIPCGCVLVQDLLVFTIPAFSGCASWEAAGHGSSVLVMPQAGVTCNAVFSVNLSLMHFKRELTDTSRSLAL